MFTYDYAEGFEIIHNQEAAALVREVKKASAAALETTDSEEYDHLSDEQREEIGVAVLKEAGYAIRKGEKGERIYALVKKGVEVRLYEDETGEIVKL